MFILTICCLTTSNYLDSWAHHSRFLCNAVLCSIRFSFQHQTHPWLCRFRFYPAASFFLGLLVILLHASSLAYWTPSDLGNSSSGVISFCPFILLVMLSRQVYWGGLPFPSPVDHALSNLSAMTHLSWVVLHGMGNWPRTKEKASWLCTGVIVTLSG